MENNSQKPSNSAQLARIAAMAAVGLSGGLVLAKSWAWMQGGSAALLASLVDSVIDALISFTNYLAIRYAHRPADHDHRFGHGKAEGIAALAQSAFIAGSCVFVLLEAIRLLQAPKAVGAVDFGIWVLVAASLATLALTRYQAYAAKVSHSLAVEADAAHYTGDVAVNGGVIISLLAGKYLGWLWIDPVVALVVAGWLLYSARLIGVKAINMLLDRELEDDTRAKIFSIIAGTKGVEGLHDLRTRRSGPRVMMSFDIEVDSGLSMVAAHDIAQEVEQNLLANYPNAEVMIHIDPKGGDITDSRHKQLHDFHVR
ncbi:MAG: cation diffusion facilitator family transporter [Alphaproteobacteria bacterium]|nr:cation diffusion facilitator family transporter [Alphaproteobacteria bacterium]